MEPNRNSSDLEGRAFRPLPLGSVKPRKWLYRQLDIQAEGLTGHIDEIWSDLADNAWLDGENDGWERGPYYADGLVPLAYLLEDDRLIEKAETWVEGFLKSQRENGWIGPDAVEEGLDPNDPWPRFVVCKVLRQYYEATGDERAIDAITRFAKYLLEKPDEWSIEEWAAMRWMDLAVTLHWLYERSGEGWLLDVVDLLVDRGYDWTEHFQHFEYERKQIDDPRMATHVVNNAMGIKSPAVHYRQYGTKNAQRGSMQAIDVLDTFHGQATGLFTGDEHLSGKNPSQGTELCAVVEYLYSLEYLASALGESAFGDRMEQVAYNALPATFTPDMWAHQYDQQANQVLCNVAERSWTNGPDANVFGQTSHFGCCHANFHQGWPKFAASLWMGTEDGLATVAYAPSEVTTTLDSGEVLTIVEETQYPFDDTVTLRVKVDEPIKFPLHLRIPSWTDDMSISLPGGETRMPSNVGYHIVEREWSNGEELDISFSPSVEVERRHHGSVALHRGPLVFSLPIAAQRTRIGGTPPHGDWEYYPTEAWNYGVDIDVTEPSTNATLEGVSETPFNPDDPPMSLDVNGRRVSEWHLKDNWVGQIPASPTQSTAPMEDLTLVPYGATQLRVTEFPLLNGSETQEETTYSPEDN
jgi:hypothetical protein